MQDQLKIPANYFEKSIKAFNNLRRIALRLILLKIVSVTFLLNRLYKLRNDLYTLRPYYKEPFGEGFILFQCIKTFFHFVEVE